MALFLLISGAAAAGLAAYLFFTRAEEAYLRSLWFGEGMGPGRKPLLLRLHLPLIALCLGVLRDFSFQDRLPFLRRWGVAAGFETEYANGLIFSWGVVMGAEFFLAAGCWGGWVGFLAPWIWLYHKHKKRLVSVARTLPDFMDLTAVAVLAGVDFLQAVERVTAGLPASPWKEEMENFLGRLKKGEGRREVFRELARRVPLPEVRHWAAAVIESLSMGLPLSPLLLASASEMRQKRLFRAEEEGAKAAQRLLIPLIFCILPATFLTIFAPLAIRYFTEGWEGFLK